MDSEDYDNKMHEHLACGSYRKLDQDPSKKICSLVTSVIKNSNLNEDIKTKLYPKEAMVPRIYGLPKIHKDGVPLRPIVNTIGSPAYKLARLLANLRKPLVGKTISFVKDSASWINEIGNEKLNIGDILVRLDVVSSYTKIPANDAIETIRSITNDDIAKLVEVCLRSTFSPSKRSSMNKWKESLWDHHYLLSLQIFIWIVLRRFL